MAIASSRSAAVGAMPGGMPSRAKAAAVSGLIPTITVRAPRRPAIRAKVPQGARGKGVEHIDRCDIDDDAATAVPADLFDEVVLEPGQLPIIERRMDGCDQVAAQPEDRDGFRLLGGVVGHGFLPTGSG